MRCILHMWIGAENREMRIFTGLGVNKYWIKKSRGVEVRASLCPHMIRSDHSPSSNTCTGDWQFWLLTGQPHNRKHLPELLLDVYPRLMSFYTYILHRISPHVWWKVNLWFLCFSWNFFFNNSGSRFLVSLSLSIITRLPFVDNLIMVIVKVLASTWRTFSLVQRCSHKWGFCIFPGPSCGPWLPLMVLFHISSLTECHPFKSLRQTK